MTHTYELQLISYITTYLGTLICSLSIYFTHLLLYSHHLTSRNHSIFSLSPCATVSRVKIQNCSLLNNKASQSPPLVLTLICSMTIHTKSSGLWDFSTKCETRGGRHILPPNIGSMFYNPGPHFPNGLTYVFQTTRTYDLVYHHFTIAIRMFC